MEEIAEEPIALLERVTALDIGKAALTARAGAARPRQEPACRRSAPASQPPCRCWGCGTSWSARGDPGGDGGRLRLLETA
jgi:hypothetical protein